VPSSVIFFKSNKYMLAVSVPFGNCGFQCSGCSAQSFLLRLLDTINKIVFEAHYSLLAQL
jgi:hypothetical protein